MSRLAVLCVVALLALTGCTATRGHDVRTTVRGSSTPAPSCLAPPSAPSGAPAEPTAAAQAGGAQLLRDVTLPCFVGGQPVRLAHLGTPAVVNLWASWCAPCRTELPQLQRYADQAAGRIQVIGVISNDPVRSAPQSLIDDLGLRFPMLDDRSGGLAHRVGVQVLPMTLLVDAEGRVVYRYNARPLDEAALSGLVARYLGVRA